MANQMEMVNGKLQPMSNADQAAYDARQLAWPAIQAAAQAKAALPDLATQVAQITAVLVNLGGNVPDAVITAANDKLADIGQPKISIQSVGIMKVGL